MNLTDDELKNILQFNIIDFDINNDSRYLIFNRTIKVDGIYDRLACCILLPDNINLSDLIYKCQNAQNSVLKCFKSKYPDAKYVELVERCAE